MTFNSCFKFHLTNILLILIIFIQNLNAHDVTKNDQNNDIIIINNNNNNNNDRKLSLDYDLFTEESVKTFNGVPPQTSCPIGHYRDGTSRGPREDGCLKCPRGRYGSTTGLTSASCTKPCPAGRYSFKEGITSDSECFLCPLGRYGSQFGLTSAACDARCPTGRYTSTTGNTRIGDCKTCPPGYRGYQCTWAVNPRAGADHDNADNDEIFGI